MARKETGIDYELIVKAIYEALLKQDNVNNLDIRHNTIIKGKGTSHQIDVYWKFRAGGVDYETIVQVKKEKNRVSQGDILLFSGVVNDIPGKPKGIFIARSGFSRFLWKTFAPNAKINSLRFSFNNGEARGDGKKRHESGNGQERTCFA